MLIFTFVFIFYILYFIFYILYLILHTSYFIYYLLFRTYYLLFIIYFFICSFEGINLALPIQASMKHPEVWHPLLSSIIIRGGWGGGGMRVRREEDNWTTISNVILILSSTTGGYWIEAWWWWELPTFHLEALATSATLRTFNQSSPSISLIQYPIYCLFCSPLIPPLSLPCPSIHQSFLLPDLWLWIGNHKICSSLPHLRSYLLVSGATFPRAYYMRSW